MGHHQQAYDNQKKQVQGCKVNVIITTNLICVLFEPAIPTSSFNFIVFYTYYTYSTAEVGGLRRNLDLK